MKGQIINSRKNSEYWPESQVVTCWQRQIYQGRRFVAIDGQSVEVLYPGRLNDSRGGDFREAVILSGRKIQQGNIEIHSRTSGWETHGHHLDPQYNQVVLHVAWQQDNAGITRLENGQKIPTIVLDRDLASMEAGRESFPCHQIPAIKLSAVLERLGEIRLGEKVRRFRWDLKAMGPEQAFYSGFLEALGYTKNQKPFLELSALASIKVLKPLVKDDKDRIGVQAFLLGSAGLLPSQRGIDNGGDRYIRDLENGWNAGGFVQACSFPHWEIYKVRPGNYPVRRILALSDLLFRYRRLGWLETWRRVLNKAVTGNSRVDLCALLRVRAEGYWHSHRDFYLPQTKGGGWLLGRERAVEIIVNVVLPFFIVWSGQQGEMALATGLEKLYHGYPSGQTNSIQKHMLAQLKAKNSLINSACRQQGLLYLYKAYCTQGRCVECYLNE